MKNKSKRKSCLAIIFLELKHLFSRFIQLFALFLSESYLTRYNIIGLSDCNYLEEKLLLYSERDKRGYFKSDKLEMHKNVQEHVTEILIGRHLLFLFILKFKFKIKILNSLLNLSRIFKKIL